MKIEELVTILKFYEEKARAVAKYMEVENTNALEAVIMEIKLDGGKKARDVLKINNKSNKV